MNKPVRIEPRLFQDKHCFYVRKLMGGLKRFQTLEEAQKAKSDDIAAHGNKVKMWANVEGEKYVQQRCDGRYYRARVYIVKEAHEKVSKNLDVVLRFRDHWLNEKIKHAELNAKPKKAKKAKVTVKKEPKPRVQKQKIETSIYLMPNDKYFVSTKLVTKILDTLEQARQYRDEIIAERNKAKNAKKAAKEQEKLDLKRKKRDEARKARFEKILSTNPEPKPKTAKLTPEQNKQSRIVSRSRLIKKQKTNAEINAAIAAMNKEKIIKREPIKPIHVITNKNLTIQQRLEQLRVM